MCEKTFIKKHEIHNLGHTRWLWVFPKAHTNFLTELTFQYFFYPDFKSGQLLSGLTMKEWCAPSETPMISTKQTRVQPIHNKIGSDPSELCIYYSNSHNVGDHFFFPSSNKSKPTDNNLPSSALPLLPKLSNSMLILNHSISTSLAASSWRGIRNEHTSCLRGPPCAVGSHFLLKKKKKFP